ncbi:hypothetical protein EIP91_005972 [Steccherinum ochraceum]|uniref:Uncharacterized protein n=1 Tax=Steccherinum ochraceum TaxID=92696 RepID=A0A4R0RLE7_9APHY|nr:hypothetical protein EIP91_005972 [Steccherinum ochraceum]
MVLQPWNRQTIDQLYREWDEIHKEYRDVVWVSREHAGEAQALATDYAQVCIPRLKDSTIPLDSKLLELGDYAKATARRISSYEALQERLANLQSRIKTLRGRCITVASRRRWVTVGNVLGRAVVLINELLGVLEQRNSNFLPHDLDNLSALDILSTLSPDFVQQARDDTPVHKRLFAVSSQPSAVPNQHASNEYAISTGEPPGLVERMLAISTLSRAINTDIQDARSRLEATGNECQKIMDVASAELHAADVLYAPLISALHKYQVAVIDA